MNKSYKILLLLGSLLLAFLFMTRGEFLGEDSYKTIAPTPQKEAVPETFKYKGEEGKDALSILKAKTSVELDRSGMVVSINGRAANSSNREYWTFYVNGEMASVGAGDYKTKSGDEVLWKIEKY